VALEKVARELVPVHLITVRPQTVTLVGHDHDLRLDTPCAKRPHTPHGLLKIYLLADKRREREKETRIRGD